MKSIVIYYSWSGKTVIVAEQIATYFKADTCRIEDINKPSALSTYFLGSFAALRSKSFPIKPLPISISPYERVIIGSPVWAGNPTPQINELFKHIDLSGKQCIAFVTTAGTEGLAALNSLSKKISSQGARLVQALEVQTNGSQETIKEKTLKALKLN